MPQKYFAASGEVIPVNEVKIEKSRDMSLILQSGNLPFVVLKECRRVPETNAEVVVLDTEVELGQKNVNDIRDIERIAVIFHSEDSAMPEVLALRTDFPKVPHLYLGQTEFPRRLCLYEEDYNSLKLRWTPIRIIERIREWLALTAKGKLHANDQPLEPLLIGSIGRIVVPHNLFIKSNEDALPELMSIHRVSKENEELFLISNRLNNKVPLDNSAFVATVIRSKPQQHGIISKSPQNLRELHDFLCKGEIDLITELRKRLIKWQSDTSFKKILDAKLIILVEMPKIRGDLNAPEASEAWAFATTDTIKQIGQEIGIWGMQDNDLGILIPPKLNKYGDSVTVFPLNPSFSFSKEMAAFLNGFKGADRKKLTVIGLGALGSQVFMNLIRSGFGNWTLIDEDCLLPHNLARHALTSFEVGHSKAAALAGVANNLYNGEIVARAVNANVLKPGERNHEVNKAFDEAECILDISTSVAVARHLARDVKSAARRVSTFLNPMGTDGVMLAEDVKRQIPIDYVEMQYYRVLINDQTLDNHLQLNNQNVRYANSCRDISSTIPQDYVALHSAICSMGFREVLSQDSAKISIWRMDPSGLNVENKTFIPESMIQHQFGDWTLCTDVQFYDKVRKLRAGKLPNETGGVLIGSFDMQRKIVYIVDTLPSPPDSKEWPTVYIRGSEGLSQQMDHIGRVTAGMLEYVGEWHSHPDGFGYKLSSDDSKAFKHLSQIMNPDGFPAIMLIVGCNGEGWYIGKIY